MSQYDEQNPEIAQEAVAFDIGQRIFELIRQNPNDSLKTIAEILGATKYLSVIDVGNGKAPVLHFDVRSFVGELKSTKKLQTLVMPSAIGITNETFLPPDAGEIKTGGGTGIEQKDVIPRTRYLIEVLSELDLAYKVYNGVNQPNMMRKLSYQAFVIPDIKKLVLVNNEEGNATFIIHDAEEEVWRHFVSKTKDELKSLDQGKVTVVFFNKSPEEWKQEMTLLLMFGVPQKTGDNLELESDEADVGLPVEPESIPDLDTKDGQPEKKKKEYKKRTIESAVLELEEAFVKWQGEPKDTRGDFCIYWLIKNDYLGLDLWCRKKDAQGNLKHVSMPDLVQKSSNDELKNSFTRREKHTEAEIQTELENAFKKWQGQPTEERGKFSIQWLKDNDYSWLYDWTQGNIDIAVMVAKSKNAEMISNFERQVASEDYTEISALSKLEEVFEKWLALPENDRGYFNTNWLSQDHEDLVSWSLRKNSKGQKMHLSIEDLVAKSTDDQMKKAFTKLERSEVFTEESALLILEQGFNDWLLEPENNRPLFNPAWFRNNKNKIYQALNNWCKRKKKIGELHISMEDLVTKSDNDNLKKSFTKQESVHGRTEETALIELEEAFAKWQELPREGRPKFNQHWLEQKKNGFNGLVKWCKNKDVNGNLVNVSLEHLVNNSENQNIKIHFVKQGIEYGRTVESVLIELEEGFNIWQNQSVEKRGDFTANWLRFNGYGKLYDWCRTKKKDGSLINISINDLVSRSTNNMMKVHYKKQEKN